MLNSPLILLFRLPLGPIAILGETSNPFRKYRLILNNVYYENPLDRDQRICTFRLASNFEASPSRERNGCFIWLITGKSRLLEPVIFPWKF